MSTVLTDPTVLTVIVFGRGLIPVALFVVDDRLDIFLFMWLGMAFHSALEFQGVLLWMVYIIHAFVKV
jgi:hypothetical protein